MKAWLRSRRFVPQADPDGWGTLLRVGALAFVAAALVVRLARLIGPAPEPLSG